MAEWFLVALGAVTVVIERLYFWMRLERRLTRIETKLGIGMES